MINVAGIAKWLMFLSLFLIAYNFFGDKINWVILKFVEMGKFVFGFLPLDVLALFFWVILLFIFKVVGSLKD